MTWTVRDVMRTEVRTVDPDVTLPDLERRFVAHRVSGFPVVRDGRLVGIVSRSDVVRQLSVEQTRAESISDYYREATGDYHPEQDLEAIAERVGQRLEKLRVEDMMIRELITVGPADSLQEVARVLVEHGIHRVPVVDAGRLLGIVSTLDLVRLLAEGRVQAA